MVMIRNTRGYKKAVKPLNKLLVNSVQFSSDFVGGACDFDVVFSLLVFIWMTWLEFIHWKGKHFIAVAYTSFKKEMEKATNVLKSNGCMQ